MKGLQEASVELNPIRNDAKSDTIEMEMNQYGMVVNDFATSPAESGSPAPQVVHFIQSLHRTVEAQQLDRLVIEFTPRLSGPQCSYQHPKAKSTNKQDSNSCNTSWGELANF